MKPDYFEPANLWLLPALAPGNRKSAVERAAAAPLRDWERDQAVEMATDIAAAASDLKVAEARAKELRTQAAKATSDVEVRDLARRAAEIERAAPQVPTPPQLWTSDATPENLGMLLETHGERMAWLSAEGGFFEIVGGRYSKGVPNLDLMLKAHAGDPERVDRIGRPPVYLHEPLLTIAMSPQPELLRGLMAKPGFRGRGLLGRFLYFLPPSPLGYRTLNGPPVPKAVRAAYHDRLRTILAWPAATDDKGERQLHTVQLSHQARVEHEDFAKDVETLMRPGADFEHATDWAGKAPGAAARVAAVLHAAEHATGAPWAVELAAKTMQCAILIVATSARHALAAFALMAVDDKTAAAARLWHWIERKRLRAFRAQEAWQGLKGSGMFSRMADISAALEVLAERGYVQVVGEATGKPGRPASPRVIVRPELTECWE